MGSRNPERFARLMSLRDPGVAHLWLAVCQSCGHKGALPVRQLIRRFGELYPVEQALFSLRCDDCGSGKVAHRLARLCDPGCGRQRG